jgi:hypothetical protein
VRDVVEILERLVGQPARVEVGGESVAGEDAVGAERGAAVGVAVADADHLAGRKRRALARLAAVGAGGIATRSVSRASTRGLFWAL